MTPRADDPPLTPRPLDTADLDYPLPDRAIARQPVEPRDAARMLVVSRTAPERIDDRRVRDLPDLLLPGDLLVFNDTAVLPARLCGHRVESGGRVEGLFLEADAGGASTRWRAMLRSNGRLRPGVRIAWTGPDQAHTVITHLVDRDEAGWTLEAERLDEPHDPVAVLRRIGHVPLPPYILAARAAAGDDADAGFADEAWYQTVYADLERAGSVAAPTAGLHFTQRLLAELDARGIGRCHVTLHVGPGTFKPVETASLADHPMHSEWYEVGPDALRSIARARTEGGRVLAVGTTTTRTLESLPDPLPAHPTGPISGWTDLLIAPGHRFRHLDGMLTNFHLPRSTLIALVAAALGLDRTLALYRHAVSEGYRFYSYGDAMLILP